MTTAYAPNSGIIRVVGGFDDVKKINVSTNPRAFPQGSALWLNKVAGRYQAEPVLLSATNATTDSTSANSTGSNYTSAASVQTAVAALFIGISAEARVPQQLASVGNFGVGGASQAYPMDASKPFISYWDEGIAVAPIGPNGSTNGVLTVAVEPGTMVTLDGFQNEETTGFYDPAGALQKSDTDYYLYNCNVLTTATAACAIGIVVERAEVGQNYLKFKFKAAPFSTRLGGV